MDFLKGQIGFIARTIRGFNFTDCRKYEDRTKHWWFGTPPPDLVFMTTGYAMIAKFNA